MKKFFLLPFIILATNVANARTEYYASAKMGVGDTTIYLNGNDTFGDYLVAISGDGYKYDASGLLLEISPAVGIDWTMGDVYGLQSRYEWFHLRLEGEFGYNRYRENGKLKYNYTITDRTEINLDQFFLLANGYADFKIDRVIPYVGLGLGYGFGKQEIILTNDYGEHSDSINDNGIIYALYAGVGYKISDVATFDVGYRKLYAPAEDDGMYVYDALRLGARFRI